MKKYSIVIIALLFQSYFSFGQKYPLKNEINIYSFKCLDNYVVSLAIDSSNNYVVYRLIMNDSIRMEYPKKNLSSWKKMKYTTIESTDEIFKGAKNLNYVSFLYKERKYIIFHVYSSIDNKYRLGVKVVDLKLKKIINYIGIPETEKGSLDFFKDKKLERDEKLYHVN